MATAAGSRRSKVKDSRRSELNKLKQRRLGLTEDRYNVKEETNVYDMVDDDEYAELVHQRQAEDWIIDDEGIGGYREDGREIFDDCEEDDDVEGNYQNYGRGSKKGKKIISMKNKVKTNELEEEPARRHSIKRYLLKTHASLDKNKKISVNLDEDKLLKQIIDDEDEKLEPINLVASASKSVQLKKKIKIEQNSYESYSSPILKPKPFKRLSATPKRKHQDIEQSDDDDADFDSCLDSEFIQNLEKASVKKIKTEPKFFNSEEQSDFDYDAGVADSEETDFTSGIEVDMSSPFTPTPTDTSESSAQDLVYTADCDRILRFYWLDAHEDPTKYPGRVYLFGKIRSEASGSESSYDSCCIIVEKIDRRIHFLPRRVNNETIPINALHKEFNEVIAPKYGIKEFKYKKQTKYYSFEHVDVPYESDYLEVLYPSNYKQLPSELTGKTFAHVFGTSQSPLERLILDLKLKGPCWLKVKQPQVSSVPVSWCKKEFTLDFSAKSFEIDDDKTIPPLVVSCVNMRTFSNQLVAISCLTKTGYRVDADKPSSPFDFTESFCSVTRPAGNQVPFPFDFSRKIREAFKSTKEDFVKIYENEQFMLNQFLILLYKIDPDIIVGHDLTFDINTILTRQTQYKDKINWSRLSRLKRSSLKETKSQKERQAVTAGRILCDVKTMAQEFCRLKSYELDQLVKALLNKERLETPNYIPSAYTSSKTLYNFLQSLLLDNRFILEIMNELNVLPLAMQITKIAGNLLSRTLMGGRAERNEYLLLHAFNEKNFILPDKNGRRLDGVDNDTKARKKAAYSGGLVLEPKVGYYDSFILLMDFNSLYPSIIQEYNICFTTVSTDKKKMKTDQNGEELPELPDPQKVEGILPAEMRKLVEGRRQVKKLMKDSKFKDGKNKLEYKQLDIRQMALKLTANSMYGCLGFVNSRFYAKPLAALITHQGREILMKTKLMAESLNLEVIYGDTDSIMINTTAKNYDEVMAMGIRIQAASNGVYKRLELGIDGVYKPMLLLKKKKYAAISISEQKTKTGAVFNYKVELKGLDIVRRDWSIIAKEEGEKIVHLILNVESLNSKKPSEKTLEEIVREIHNEMKNISEYIKAGNFDADAIKKFEIVKQLTKNPDDYPDKKHLVHVNVALRRNQDAKLERKFRAGDVIPYIICVKKSDPNFSQLPSTQRAFHPDELKNDPDLKIDADYYLSQQIHPVVSRLCEPLEGTDSHILAEFLGVESSIHRPRRRSDDDDIPVPRDESRFDSCEPLIIKCPRTECAQLISVRSPFKYDDETKNLIGVSLSRCPHCRCNFAQGQYENRIINSFNSQIRSLIKRFYQSPLVCKEDSKHFTTSYLGYYSKSKMALCCEKCGKDVEREINDNKLYDQLKFFEYLLNIDAALNSISSLKERSEMETKSNPLRKLYSRMKEINEKKQSFMSYTIVNLTKLFADQYFFSIKSEKSFIA